MKNDGQANPSFLVFNFPFSIFRLRCVQKERDGDILSVLARWSSGTEAPAALRREWRHGWQSLLGNPGKREVAAFALLRQALEKGAGDELRRLPLEVWHSGTEEAMEATHLFVSVASRLEEVRARLGAGTEVDFGEERPPPAQWQYPQLALPPVRITGGEWKMENGELKMEN